MTHLGIEGHVGEKVIKENEPATINCNEEVQSSAFFWIRMKENGFEYIGMFSISKKKGTAADENKFTLHENFLQLNTFESVKDSGTYSCVFLNKNELHFTCTTKLRGETGGLVKVCTANKRLITPTPFTIQT